MTRRTRRGAIGWGANRGTPKKRNFPTFFLTPLLNCDSKLCKKMKQYNTIITMPQPTITERKNFFWPDLTTKYIHRKWTCLRYSWLFTTNCCLFFTSIFYCLTCYWSAAQQAQTRPAHTTVEHGIVYKIGLGQKPCYYKLKIRLEHYACICYGENWTSTFVNRFSLFTERLAQAPLITEFTAHLVQWVHHQDVYKALLLWLRRFVLLP
jgi:hypothetical protein